tara:strand:- start:341 stop:733 length:393 start_codon:yes stop_codon:yes gene_type:complete
MDFTQEHNDKLRKQVASRCQVDVNSPRIDELQLYNQRLKQFVSESANVLSSLSASKGDDKGVFCVDLNNAVQDSAFWLYFNFSQNDWPSKLYVSKAAIDMINKQKKKETVCGLLFNNTILFVQKFRINNN